MSLDGKFNAMQFGRKTLDNNNNNAGVFILRRLHPDDSERVITTLWTEVYYI